MKYGILLAIVLAFLFLVGCTQKEAPAIPPVAPANLSANASSPQPAQINQTQPTQSMENVLKQIEPKCGTLTASFLETCVYRRGYELMADDFCGKYSDYQLEKCMKNSTYASSCKSMLENTYPVCVSVIAIQKRDAAYCSKIGERESENINLLIAICNSSVSMQKESDRAGNAQTLGDCKNLSNTLFMDKCLSSASLASMNVGLCANISLSTSRDGCYSQYAEAAKNPEWCGKMNAFNSSAALLNSSRMNCISRVAVVAKNEGFCAGSAACIAAVKKDYASCSGNSSCIMDVALLNRDVQGCLMLPETATDSATLGRCVGWSAFYANDVKMCADAGKMQGWCENLAELRD